jgi:nitric oxide reductase NorE protein
MHSRRSANRGPSTHWPGEPALWSFIGGDMIVFAVMFIALSHERLHSKTVFRAGHDTLDQGLGLTNTLLLLSSSWFVASAVAAVRNGRPRLSNPLLSCAILCALAFCGIKAVEYHEKIAAGFTPMTDLFFAYYFVVTGIHLLHVILAIGVMLVVALRQRRSELQAADGVLLESAAVFWHLVDILWIFLFALIYMMR